MKLSDRLEDIFAHAVALEQNGRLRSTVYCIGLRVFILNQDQTVFLRFRLRKVDKMEFTDPISFNANDYDSKHLEVADGKIQFIQEAGGWERTKSCKTPRMSPENVQELFSGFEVEEVNTVTLHSSVLALLEENLSHVEFTSEDGELVITQRNIYSGAVITLRRKETGGLLEQKGDLGEFEPVGIRTPDLQALFTFVDTLDFHFLPDGFIVVDSKNPKIPMRGLISKCRYDELGTTESRPDKAGGDLVQLGTMPGKKKASKKKSASKKKKVTK